MTRKLNTTGTLWEDNFCNVYSYRTQLTGFYKGLSVFNNTFYSMTTRKHQGQFNKNIFDLILTTCKFSTRLEPDEVEQAIKYELYYIDNRLKELDTKRSTQKKKDTIKNLLNRKEFLTSVLNK